MPYNGTGTFSLTYSFTTEAATPPININKLDQQFDDIAQGLTIALTRDGQSKPTVNMDWNGKRLMNLGTPQADADAATVIWTKTYFVRVDQSNTFQGNQIIVGDNYTLSLQGNAPVLYLHNTAATPNNRKWRMWADNNGILRMDCMNDATDTVLATFFSYTRSSGQVGLAGNSFVFNGNTVWHSSNDGSGSTLDADLLDGQHGSFYQNAGNLNAGQLDNARVAQGNVTQHQTALALNANQSSTGVVQYAGGSLALTNAHRETIIYCQGASTITLNNGVFNAGDSVAIIRYTTGTVSFVAGSSSIATPNNALSIAAQYGVVVATFIGSGVWVLSGALG